MVLKVLKKMTQIELSYCVSDFDNGILYLLHSVGWFYRVNDPVIDNGVNINNDIVFR